MKTPIILILLVSILLASGCVLKTKPHNSIEPTSTTQTMDCGNSDWMAESICQFEV